MSIAVYLPSILCYIMIGNSPQPASPAANSPLETKEWREESKRVTRSSQRAQIHDSNNNDEVGAGASYYYYSAPDIFINSSVQFVIFGIIV